MSKKAKKKKIIKKGVENKKSVMTKFERTTLLIMLVQTVLMILQVLIALKGIWGQ